jgi:hypothetical protein
VRGENAHSRTRKADARVRLFPMRSECPQRPSCCPREVGLDDRTTQIPAVETLTARPTAMGRLEPVAHGPRPARKRRSLDDPVKYSSCGNTPEAVTEPAKVDGGSPARAVVQSLVDEWLKYLKLRPLPHSSHNLTTNGFCILASPKASR